MTGLEKLLRWNSMRGGISTQEATTTGNPATFETTLVRPLVKCEAAFAPVQEGTGDPSPSNVRPINGWTWLIVSVSPTASGGTQYPVNWQTAAGTVYGGYVDLVSGVLTVTYEIVNLKDLDWSLRSSAPYCFSANVAKDYLTEGVDATEQISDIYPVRYTSSRVNAKSGYINMYRYGPSTPTNNILYLVFDDDVTSKSKLDDWLAEHDPHLCYRLATQNTYQLSPQTIRTLAGENNVWSNANGDMTVKYVKKGA